MKSTCLIALMMIAFSLTLSACGKKGSPEPPGPTSDITYPHIYPSR